MESSLQEHKTSWLDRPLSESIRFNWETVIFLAIILLAIWTRFYDLESRVMSHDETSHVYFSWLFSEGRGYKHDPVTHGPLQFHLVALSYFLFGDNDFTARVPAALFSVATIAFMWFYRRLFGRAGALVGAVLLLISPYILYYGRYVRNEAFVGLFGVITIWAMLRYLESGQNRYLFWLTAVTALHFTTKETSFIYTAQVMIFLGLYIVLGLPSRRWENEGMKRPFTVSVGAGLAGLALGGFLFLRSRAASTVAAQATEAAETTLAAPAAGPPALALIILILATLGLVAGVYFLVRGYSWQQLRRERAFSMLLLLGTLVLPMLAPFPVKFLGYNPISYSSAPDVSMTITFIVIFSLFAIFTGWLWNFRLWLINAAIFYAIFTVFYTSMFTNGTGIATGLVGSLGYWLEQQGVNRGSQPWYYYWALQIPIYEYLPAIGTLLALFLAPGLLARRKRALEAEEQKSMEISEEPEAQLVEIPDDAEPLPEEDRPLPGVTVALLLFWSFTSLLAYSVAGEKMPWLTFHIALPMILTTAWLIGQLIDGVDWQAFRRQRGVLAILLLLVFFPAMLGVSGALLGPNPPFSGNTLAELGSTGTFITSLLVVIFSGWGLASLMRDWTSSQFTRIITLTVFGLLGVLTARTGFMAAYINYNNATEYLVYAHSASGPKLALEQIEEISRRTTGGLAIRVSYDDETTYPYWWYLRNYTNTDFYGGTPSRAQRESPLIIVGEANYGKIEPVVGQAYNMFEYNRIWWPNQDYFNLTRQRILDALLNPQMRAALFQIWLNRDYSEYAQLTGQDMSLENWRPSGRMRLYIRKDIIAELWNYGVAPEAEAVVADPYEGKAVEAQADIVVGAPGTELGQFQQPRGIAVAPDASVYVADTNNHRIQHLAPDGTPLNMWGTFADATAGDAPGGTFNEPWGIAVGPDGSVYVADTWNHRVQKFSPDGEFITSWGFFGQAETPFAFWGPRDIAVDAMGRVYVSDTGNKRIVVFDQDGAPITEFGEVGLEAGQFDEPVGVAIGRESQVYVADTWNQRIQAFFQADDGSYQPLKSWDVVAWYGQSLDNKPYLATGPDGNLFASDPEGYRVLEFNSDGEFLRYFGDLSGGNDGFTLVGGLDVDAAGGVWVVDSGANRIMHFVLPPTAP